MNARLLVTLGFIALIMSIILPDALAQDETILFAEYHLVPADFQAGLGQDVMVTKDGLSLAPGVNTGVVRSPTLEMSLPFNALTPSWEVDEPEDASLTIRIRTATVGGRWTAWQQVAANDDWMLPGEERLIGQMIIVPADDVTHRRIQVEIAFSRYDGGPSAFLRHLSLSLIDSTRGPSTSEMVERQAALDKALPEATIAGYSKPPVISRSVWCTDPACNYSDGLEYESVSHLIVHHTVSTNYGTAHDWAAVVRAIWAFHTFPPSKDCSNCRGWGDIGYNYLVDINGVLYEGHNGGDDVIGTHAAGANAGSMALSFLGTFNFPGGSPPGIAPSEAMKDAAAELFAWKADAKNIDVYDAGYLPNVDWGLPNLMGHRDVYGATQCPGDQAHLLLPWLRDEVASRIGFVSANIYYDELDSGFVKSSTPYWYVPIYGCGFDGHAWYTWSTTNPANSTNWAEWRPEVAETGNYILEAYAPYCITGEPETEGASYEVTHSGGTSTVIVSQNSQVGTWIELGAYEFAAGNSNVIRLTDLTTTDSGKGVWFDAIRLRPVAELVDIRNLQPASGFWADQHSVTFEWVVDGGSTVETTRLQAATDAEFIDLLLDQSFPGVQTSYTQDFGQDHALIYWRVIVTTTANQTIESEVYQLGIDTISPVSAVQGVYQLPDDRYFLILSGSDGGSGVASYDVQYRPSGGAWADLSLGISESGLPFDPPVWGQVYEFRSQARDNVGHLEPPHATADITTQQAIPLNHVIIFPLIHR